MKVNRHDQAKILSPQEIAWLFDGKVGLVSDLKLLRLLVWSGKGEGMEAGASLLPKAISQQLMQGKGTRNRLLTLVITFT